MPLPMVLATAVPKTKAAMKFQKAAQATARNGVSTRVETTVAMELAASCQPFENSKASVRTMTARSRLKALTGRPGAAWNGVGSFYNPSVRTWATVGDMSVVRRTLGLRLR